MAVPAGLSRNTEDFPVSASREADTVSVRVLFAGVSLGRRSWNEVHNRKSCGSMPFCRLLLTQQSSASHGRRIVCQETISSVEEMMVQDFVRNERDEYYQSREIW